MKEVQEEKKVYTKPEITFETSLEVKAGSPGGPPCGDGLDLLTGCDG